MIATCQGCKQGVNMPEPPPPQVVNMPDVSFIVIQHGEKGFCPRCNAKTSAVVINVNPAGITMVAAPLEEPEKSRIIKPKIVAARNN